MAYVCNLASTRAPSGLAMLSTVYREPEERGRAMAVAYSGLAFGLIGQHLIIKLC